MTNYSLKIASFGMSTYFIFWIYFFAIAEFKKHFSVTIMCRNDKLSSTMSWDGCLLKDSEFFVFFAENSQILLKISVIPFLLTFMYLVALNMFVNNQLNSLTNSSLQHIIDTQL